MPEHTGSAAGTDAGATPEVVRPDASAPLAWTSGAPKWAAAAIVAIVVCAGLTSAWRAGETGRHHGDHGDVSDARGVGTAITLADLEPDATQDEEQRGSVGGSGLRGRLDLNRATAAELELLPGIGPSASARIVAFRAQIGGFRHVDELARVRGIGEKTLARLRPLVYVGDGTE